MKSKYNSTGNWLLHYQHGINTVLTGSELEKEHFVQSCSGSHTHTPPAQKRKHTKTHLLTHTLIIPIWVLSCKIINVQLYELSVLLHLLSVTFWWGPRERVCVCVCVRERQIIDMLTLQIIGKIPSVAVLCEERKKTRKQPISDG